MSLRTRIQETARTVATDVSNEKAQALLNKVREELLPKLGQVESVKASTLNPDDKPNCNVTYPSLNREDSEVMLRDYWVKPKMIVMVIGKRAFQ